MTAPSLRQGADPGHALGTGIHGYTPLVILPDQYPGSTAVKLVPPQQLLEAEVSEERLDRLDAPTQHDSSPATPIHHGRIRPISMEMSPAASEVKAAAEEEGEARRLQTPVVAQWQNDDES